MKQLSPSHLYATPLARTRARSSGDAVSRTMRSPATTDGMTRSREAPAALSSTYRLPFPPMLKRQASSPVDRRLVCSSLSSEHGAHASGRIFKTEALSILRGIFYILLARFALAIFIAVLVLGGVGYAVLLATEPELSIRSVLAAQLGL